MSPRCAGSRGSTFDPASPAPGAGEIQVHRRDADVLEIWSMSNRGRCALAIKFDGTRQYTVLSSSIPGHMQGLSRALLTDAVNHFLAAENHRRKERAALAARVAA